MRGKRESQVKKEEDEQEQSNRIGPSFLFFFDLHLFDLFSYSHPPLSFQNNIDSKTNANQRLRLRSVPSIDEIGGPIEGLTCIVTGPTR